MIEPTKQLDYSTHFERKTKLLLSRKDNNWRAIIELIISRCKTYSSTKSKVLDIGCGVGTLLLCLRLLKYECYGVDFDKGQVEAAKKISKKYNFEDIHFSQSNMDELPFDSATFDITMSKDVVEHLPDSVLNDYLKESNRILKDDGVLIISTKPTKYTYLFKKNTLFLVLPFFFLKHRYFSKILKKIDDYLPPLYKKITGRFMRDTWLEPAPGHCNCPNFDKLVTKVKDSNFSILESYAFIRPEQKWFKLVNRIFSTNHTNSNIFIVAKKISPTKF